MVYPKQWELLTTKTAYILISSSNRNMLFFSFLFFQQNVFIGFFFFFFSKVFFIIKELTMLKIITLFLEEQNVTFKVTQQKHILQSGGQLHLTFLTAHYMERSYSQLCRLTFTLNCILNIQLAWQLVLQQCYTAQTDSNNLQGVMFEFVEG